MGAAYQAPPPIDWASVSMPTIAHACSAQANSASAVDWPADLSAINLPQYLNTVPEGDRWWTLPLPSASASASAVPPVAVLIADIPPVAVLIADVLPAEDGALIHFCIICLQSNCAQPRWTILWTILSPLSMSTPLHLNCLPNYHLNHLNHPESFPLVRPVLAKIRGRHVKISWSLRWPRRLRFPRHPSRRDVVTPPLIRLRWRSRPARRSLPPGLPLRPPAHLKCLPLSHLWRSAPHPPSARAPNHPLARYRITFHRLWARCVTLNTCSMERPHVLYLQERCDPCINKGFKVCYAQDKPQTTACESCANLKKQCKKPAFWAMNITDLSTLCIHLIFVLN